MSKHAKPNLTDSRSYKVEEVVSHRERNGSLQFLLKWKGCPPSETTWEDSENLSNCPALISDYWDRQAISDSPIPTQPSEIESPSKSEPSTPQSTSDKQSPEEPPSPDFPVYRSPWKVQESFVHGLFPNWQSIRTTIPYLDPRTPIEKPTKVLGLNKLPDETILVLTETEHGRQILTKQQMVCVAENLLLEYFERYIW
jgi:hypothetical protein